MNYMDKAYPEDEDRLYLDNEDEAILNLGWLNEDVSFHDLFCTPAVDNWKADHALLSQYMMGPYLMLPTMTASNGVSSFVMAITGFLFVKELVSECDTSTSAVNI